jgi:hypothetical protein
MRPPVLGLALVLRFSLWPGWACGQPAGPFSAGPPPQSKTLDTFSIALIYVFF